MTVLVGISSLSTPGKLSARVGPTLRNSTGLRNSSACFNKLTYELPCEGFPEWLEKAEGETYRKAE